MKIVVRRRLAVGALGTATAVAAGFLALPSAQAASNTLTVNPSFAYNSETKTITVAPTSSGNPGYPPGSTVTFTRTGTTDSFSKTVDPSPPNAPTVTVDFTDVGDGVGQDGPANPGSYDVTIASPVGASQYSDSCSACFTVLTPNANPTVTAITPTGLAQGGSGNVTVTGTGFARGSVIAVLLPDGSGPDTGITTNAAPKDSSGKDITNGITTNTTIQRYWTVSSTAITGARDVRVTNTDGTFAVCSKCFTVNGGPLTAVTPTAGSNNPAAGLTRVTFTGTGLTSGEPRLVYVADAGSSTKSDLTLIGTNASYNGTSVSADFDLRSAAPGNAAYQPTLVQADGSQNTCACRFSVGQVAPATITSLDKTSQQAGTTQTVRVTGTNFSKGVRIAVSGAGVTTTAVSFVSPTAVDATFSVDSTAANGARDVTPTTTDGTAGTACKGCYTITGGTSGSASPSASATPTASVSPSASGSPCPTATATPVASASGSPSASASPSSGGGLPLPLPGGTSASPSSSSSAACKQLTISVNPADIVPNEASTVTVTGQPNTPVELWAYSRPSTTYGKVRSGTLNANGSISWNVTPGGNTRLYAHYARPNTTTSSDDSPSVVIEVHTSLSLSAYRDGVRKYHFQGTNLPRRAGQLITLYRYATGPNLDQYCVPTPESDTTAKSDGSCHAIITAQAKTGPNNTWRIDRTFTGSGRFYFVVRTSQTVDNGRGHSNQRDTVIH